MDLSYSPGQERFREEVKNWLAENMKELPGWWNSPNVSGPEVDSKERHQFNLWWHRKLYGAGFVGITWLRETLNFVKARPETNWLLKPHPSNEAYKCKQNDREELEKIIQDTSEHTIRLLPNEINTKSLLGFADVIITVLGTSGLEFSCFGIPCILAGESFYSGFGFTVEPKTKEEYFRILSNIGELKKPGKEEIERAKVATYIIFRLLSAETTFLLPDMPTANMPLLGELDEEMIWRELYQSVKKIDPLSDPFFKNLERFLDSDFTHLLNKPEFYSDIPAYWQKAKDLVKAKGTG